MASVVKRRAVLEPSKLNRDSQKAGVTMVRVVLSALVYAGKNQSPCLHETLTTTAHYAMNISVVRVPAYPQIQFIITLIIISFSSGLDSAIIMVSATKAASSIFFCPSINSTSFLSRK